MSAKKKAVGKKSKKKTNNKKTAKHAAPTGQAKALDQLLPPPFKDFYPNTVVASMVSALLLNATEKGKTFDDIEAQLQGAIDMAQASHLEGAEEYKRNVTLLHGFCKNNKDLFVKANLAIAALLQALINKPEQDWSGCFHVSHATIKGILSLKD